MIWITPAAASVPYSVAAAGPLMISRLSMSSGLKSFQREIDCEPNPCVVGPDACVLSTRTPSTKMSGLLLSDSDDAPRTRMREPVPTCPELATTLTPEARPLSRSCRLFTGCVATISDAFTVVTALPMARFSVTPAVPVDHEAAQLDDAFREHDAHVGGADGGGDGARLVADAAHGELHGAGAGEAHEAEATAGVGGGADRLPLHADLRVADRASRAR